jgi:hypothetical protein
LEAAAFTFSLLPQLFLGMVFFIWTSQTDVDNIEKHSIAMAFCLLGDSNKNATRLPLSSYSQLPRNLLALPAMSVIIIAWLFDLKLVFLIRKEAFHEEDSKHVKNSNLANFTVIPIRSTVFHCVLNVVGITALSIVETIIAKTKDLGKATFAMMLFGALMKIFRCPLTTLLTLSKGNRIKRDRESLREKEIQLALSERERRRSSENHKLVGLEDQNDF